MMPDRFIMGGTLGPAERMRLLGVVEKLGFETAFDIGSAIVACPPGTRRISLGEEGVIVGELFHPGDPHRLDALAPDACATIVKSKGERMYQAYWGNYVALIRTLEGGAVVRAPFGRLPCLFRTMQGGGNGAILAASDIDLLAAASGQAHRLDYEQIGWQLRAGNIRRPATALCGVSEVQGGSRLSWGPGAPRLDPLWNPWDFTHPDRRIDDIDEAVHRLRGTCITAIAARTGPLKKPLLLLSGGLDSSVVAAGLAARQRPFVGLNMATREHAGDEREFARIVATHLDRPLIDRPMQVSDYAFAGVGAVRLPRPVAKGYELLIYEAAMAVARENDCDGIVDGGGGDNVFCSLRSAAPAADCLMDPMGAGHFRRVCEDIGRAAMASRWQVSWRAHLRAWRPRRAHRRETDDRFLTPDVQALPATTLDHPWLDPGESGLPGRGAHIANLIAAQGYVEDGPFGSKTGAISPLATQPLIELCLAIPSWHWFAKGNTRAVARRAFERDLPVSIAWRKGKGNPEGFLAALLEANREAMRAHLVDGILAGAKIIDAPRIASVLGDPGRLSSLDYGRILALVDAESWARGIMSD